MKYSWRRGWMISDAILIKVCDRLSSDWYSHIRDKVSETSIQWMQNLPHILRFKLNGFIINVVHGSYSKTGRYIFKSTPWNEKREEFEASNADIIIAGHSGLPFSDRKENKLWFNPGVIGMTAPRGSGTVLLHLLKRVLPFCTRTLAIITEQQPQL